MSYEWGGPQPPAGTFDGQLHIDDHGVIREFSVAKSAWMKRPNYRQVESMSQELGVNGMPIGNDFWNMVTGRNTTRASNQWDDVFDKCFVRLAWWQGSAPIIQYVAHVTYAELKAYMQTNGPQAGGNYTANCVLTAYEVVSPDMRVSRMLTMHRLYGSMRGRKAYFGVKGRGTTEEGLQTRAGWGTRFVNYFSAGNLVRNMINNCWAQNPATEESRVMWFTAAKKTNRYRITRDGFVYVWNVGDGGRMVWDTVTQTYMPAPVGEYKIGTDVRWIYTQEPSGNTLQITRMVPGQVPKGSNYMRKALGVVVALPIQHADPRYKAFVLYPMGITHVTLQILQELGAASDIIAVNEYARTSLTPYWVKREAGTVNNPSINMFRLPMTSIAILLGNKGNTVKTALDDPGIPSRISFYIRNPTTGLRSAVANHRIMKIMRKNNVPIAWIEDSVLD